MLIVKSMLALSCQDMGSNVRNILHAVSLTNPRDLKIQGAYPKSDGRKLVIIADGQWKDSLLSGLGSVE